MTGYVASSSERYSGPVELEVQLDASDADALALVECHLRAFINAVDSGYFFPGSLGRSETNVVVVGSDARSARLEVNDLPKTAFDVLGALLRDCDYREVCSFRSARAILRNEMIDLLRETFHRPAAVENPPFEVEFPEELDGDTLLIEVEFAAVVPPDVGDGLLDKLALIEDLWLAYPLLDDEEPEDIEPVEVFPAQRHFNDPRTIHHYEFIWNADPIAWNLLVNLCCAWSRTIPVARLHVE